MKADWKSVDDCMAFWCTDYQDDVSSKLALVQQLAEIRSAASALCPKCKPSKECHSSVVKNYFLKSCNKTVNDTVLIK